MFYFVIFALVFALSFLLDKVLKQANLKEFNNKLLVFVISLAIIAIPVLVAGLRAINVGTDTSSYALDVYNRSVESDDYFDVLNNSNDEPGFVLLAFISAKVFRNFNVFLALIETVMVVAIFAFAINERKTIPIYITLTLYMLLCFGESLSLMRQNMAFAVMIFSATFIRKRKIIPLLVCSFIGFMFHQSALIFLLIGALLWLAGGKKKEKSKKLIIFCATVLIIISVLSLETITSIFADIGLVTDRLLVYFDQGLPGGENGILSLSFGLSYRVLLIIIFIFVALKSNKTKYGILSLLCTCFLVVDFVLYLYSMKYTTVLRLGMWFRYTAILINNPLWKYLVLKVDGKRKAELFMPIMVVAILMMNFWHTNIVNRDNNKIYPYESILVSELEMKGGSEICG